MPDKSNTTRDDIYTFTTNWNQADSCWKPLANSFYTSVFVTRASRQITIYWRSCKSHALFYYSTEAILRIVLFFRLSAALSKSTVHWRIRMTKKNTTILIDYLHCPLQPIYLEYVTWISLDYPRVSTVYVFIHWLNLVKNSRPCRMHHSTTTSIQDMRRW